MKTIETYRADGIAVEIFQNKAGKFGVRVKDTDAGMQLPLVKFFPALAMAQAYARTCL